MSREMIAAARAAMVAAAQRYRTDRGLPADSSEVAGWVAWLDRSAARLSALLAAPAATAEEIAALADAIEAMSEATRRYRIAARLPGASNDVPAWVAELDAAMVALTIIAEAEQRALLSPA